MGIEKDVGPMTLLLVWELGLFRVGGNFGGTKAAKEGQWSALRLKEGGEEGNTQEEGARIKQEAHDGLNRGTRKRQRSVDRNGWPR